MDKTETPTFGAIDYSVFASTLLISLVIGVYTSLRHNKSPEQFFMGNRSFSVIPVSMSLLTSFVSATSLLGYTGETYAYGTQLAMFLVGAVLGIGAAALIILPITYPLKLTSINEYLEMRFHSHRLRKVITFLSCNSGLLFMGICLYAPTIALASVTTLSSTTYIYILGFAVTIYSSLGGIRAVIWTDVFQLSVLLFGLLVIVIVGLWDVGGPVKVWNVSLAGGRLDMFNTSLSLYERHTLINTIIFGFVIYFSTYGVTQINVQRVCSVPRYEDAKKVMLINLAGTIFIHILVIAAGLIGYTAYADCDPWLQRIINRKEQILPYYVMDRLHFVTGLPGLFVATLTGGALSSISSVMNAVSAMIWEDYCRPIDFLEKLPPRTAGVITKILCFVIGIVIVGIALLASKAINLLQFYNTILVAFWGGVFGVFLIGFLFPKTNIYGVWTGLLASSIFVAWMSCGAILYQQPKNPLPLSIENCSLSVSSNETSVKSIQDAVQDIKRANLTNHSDIFKENLQEDFPLMMMYGISYTLYPFIGCISCIVVALIVSLITGNEDISNVSPKYVSPLVTKFYWGPENLVLYELKETKIDLKDAETIENLTPLVPKNNIK